MAVSVTNQQLVSALYVAIFNRAPDKAGLDSWVAQMAAGKSFAEVSTGFTGHEVFTQGIGTLSNAAYVNALYTNVLGSAGDAAGVRLAVGLPRPPPGDIHRAAAGDRRDAAVHRRHRRQLADHRASAARGGDGHCDQRVGRRDARQRCAAGSAA